MAVGSAIGGAIGGAAGNVFLPGIGGIIGTAIGSGIGGAVDKKTGSSSESGSGGGLFPGGGQAEAVGAGIGIAQLIAGKVKQKKADAMLPMNLDPRLASLERYYARKRRAASTGTLNNNAKALLDKTYKQSLLNASRFGGNNLNLQSAYMQNLAALSNEQERNALAYDQLFGGVTQDIAQLQLEKSMVAYDREQARAAQLLTDGKQNLGAALMKSVSTKPMPLDMQTPRDKGITSAVAEPEGEVDTTGLTNLSGNWASGF